MAEEGTSVHDSDVGIETAQDDGVVVAEGGSEEEEAGDGDHSECRPVFTNPMEGGSLIVWLGMIKEERNRCGVAVGRSNIRSAVVRILLLLKNIIMKF